MIAEIIKDFDIFLISESKLDSTFPNPLKNCWNFETVFQRNSAGIAELNIWNHSGILMEFHWNTGGILPPILSKFTACFPELFR